MLRLISYSSVDSFIKREYVLDILDKYKIQPKLEAFYNRQFSGKDDLNSDMSQIRSGTFQQQRREYYNDFEDCIRDCKNAKIKAIQKIHHSDGDNGDSDSDYVDCCESSDIKTQSTTLSSKSLPHVNTAASPTPSKNSKLYQQQLVIDVKKDLTSKSQKQTAAPEQQQLKSDKKNEIKYEKTLSSESTRINNKKQQQQPKDEEQIKNNNNSTIDSYNCNRNETSTSTITTTTITKREKSACKVDSLDGKSILNDSASSSLLFTSLSKESKSSSSTKSSSVNQIQEMSIGVEKQQSSGVIMSKMSPVTIRKAEEAVKNTTTMSTTSSSSSAVVQIGVAAEKVESKRRSCKKKLAKLAIVQTLEIPVQQQQKSKMTVASESGKKINKLDDASWGHERELILERVQNNSFGISIVGGKVNVSGDSVVSGIFIKNIIAGSSADKCGLLKVGDRILAVDDVDIRNSSHELAVKTIKNAGDKMKLLVQSLNSLMSDDNPAANLMIKFPPPPITPSVTPQPEIIQEGSEKDDIVNDDIKQMQDLKKDPKKSLTQNGVLTPEPNGYDNGRGSSMGNTPAPPDTESEGSSDDDEEDKRDMEGKTYTKAGVEIDRASAGNVKRSKEEIEADPEEENQFGYTTNKIKKRYGNLGTVLCQTIDRGHNSSIGISLAGHRDRNKMACFIAGINPKGIASSSGGLEIGDEILEANGVVLYGRCHLNASAIIKGLPGPILQLIILRRKQAVEELAVKPVTQFPVEISNEDAFASFKNVRHVTIKKGNQSLGIMIIEGKHAEVGQGIFVSDIQEGSNAEKAGLNIGDMILAVNKDSLLGCNYDTAANMLKKTEGIVTLTVCNPNKKDAAGNANEIVSTKDIDPKDPSRPVTPKPQPSPAKEIPSDPFTCEIIPNQNTSIELKLENQPIGIQVAGGSDTLVNTGAVIVNIIPGSIAEKDKRLKVYDQIIEINNLKVTPELTHELIQRAIKQVQSKVKMLIYRSEPPETESVEIELNKKGGKNLGIGFLTTNPHGLLITDIVPGGIADLDGRIQKSDIVTHVNSESISNKSLEESSTILKTVQGKVSLKFMRAKPKKRTTS